MADAVTVNQYFPAAGASSPNVVVHLTNVSDGTGESGIKKVDIATILNYFGVKPSGLRIEQAWWGIQGFTSVIIAWDRTAGANTALVLPTGVGADDFRGVNPGPSGTGGGVSDFMKLGGIPDPSAGNADGKGSILLTTKGAAANATYNITLWLRCEPNQT